MVLNQFLYKKSVAISLTILHFLNPVLVTTCIYLCLDFVSIFSLNIFSLLSGVFLFFLYICFLCFHVLVNPSVRYALLSWSRLLNELTLYWVQHIQAFSSVFSNAFITLREGERENGKERSIFVVRVVFVDTKSI